MAALEGGYNPKGTVNDKGNLTARSFHHRIAPKKCRKEKISTSRLFEELLPKAKVTLLRACTRVLVITIIVATSKKLTSTNDFTWQFWRWLLGSVNRKLPLGEASLET